MGTRGGNGRSGPPSSFVSFHCVLLFLGRKKRIRPVCRDRSAASAVPPCLALARPLTHTFDMPGGITAASRRLLLACAFGRPHGSIHNAVHLPHSTRRGSLEALCAATLPDHRFLFAFLQDTILRALCQEVFCIFCPPDLQKAAGKAPPLPLPRARSVQNRAFLFPKIKKILILGNKCVML